LVVLVAVSAAARPDPCQRKDNVPFEAIVAELSKLTGDCGAVPFCPTQTAGEIYPPQNTPKQYIGFWCCSNALPH
jgi:hypothetical protein